jgi:hypothetical protein
VFLSTLSLQPHKLISKLFLVHILFMTRLIDNVLFYFWIQSRFALKELLWIVFLDKHKLAWCCLQCCVIGASNSLVTLQLIEGSNQMDHLFLFLTFMIILQVKLSEHIIDIIQLCVLAQ